MDSFEVNKILGAVLGTLTFTLAVSIGATLLFENKAPATPGFAIAVPKTGAVAAAAPKVEPIAVRLAKADPKKGEALTKQCQSCHNFSEGQGAKVGPDLYGVVGRPIAHQSGFSYTSAIKKLADKQKTWTFANLDEWLTSPRDDAPGTAMSFAGITRPDQRADVIAYLNQNSAKPEALPKPEAAAPAPAKKADTGAANVQAGANAAAAAQKAQGATGEPFQSQTAKPSSSAAPLPGSPQQNGKLQPPAANPGAGPAPAGTAPTPPNGQSTPQGANTPAGGTGSKTAVEPSGTSPQPGTGTPIQGSAPNANTAPTTQPPKNPPAAQH